MCRRAAYSSVPRSRNNPSSMTSRCVSSKSHLRTFKLKNSRGLEIVVDVGGTCAELHHTNNPIRTSATAITPLRSQQAAFSAARLVAQHEVLTFFLDCNASGNDRYTSLVICGTLQSRAPALLRLPEPSELLLLLKPSTTRAVRNRQKQTPPD